MKRWILVHIGLAKPHRFERTLAVLVSLGLLGVTVMGTVYFRFADGLMPGTPRWWYFLYVAALLGFGVISARLPRIAMIVLSLAALEVGLGLGSAVLYSFHLTPADLLPPNQRARTHTAWHPLLQAVMKPTVPGELEPGEHFFNSKGLRGQERSVQELRGKAVVALFGGSTVEDIFVPDGKTWGEQLEQMLGAERFAVLNHGVSMYSTAQVVLQTAFYQSPFGVKPVCAIYYVGGIDVQAVHIRGLDPGFADYQVPALVDALEARQLDGESLAFSSALRYLNRLAVLAFDTVRPPGPPSGEISADPDPALEAIFVRNMHTISAINRERGVRTLWVGEIVDRTQLAQGLQQSIMWAPFLREKDLWGLQQRMNGIMKREAAVLGDVYVDVPVEDFQPDDFADATHFEVTGSLKFAAKLAPEVERACSVRAR